MTIFRILKEAARKLVILFYLVLHNSENFIQQRSTQMIESNMLSFLECVYIYIST